MSKGWEVNVSLLCFLSVVSRCVYLSERCSAYMSVYYFRKPQMTASLCTCCFDLILTIQTSGGPPLLVHLGCPGLFCFPSIFWPHLCLMQDLSSPTRVGTVPSAVEAQGLNHWTTREVPCLELFNDGLVIWLLDASSFLKPTPHPWSFAL